MIVLVTTSVEWLVGGWIHDTADDIQMLRVIDHLPGPVDLSLRGLELVCILVELLCDPDEVVVELTDARGSIDQEFGELSTGRIRPAAPRLADGLFDQARTLRQRDRQVVTQPGGKGSDAVGVAISSLVRRTAAGSVLGLHG